MTQENGNETVLDGEPKILENNKITDDEKLPENTETVLQDGDKVQENDEKIEEDADKLPENIDKVPEEVDKVPEETDKEPEDAEKLPEDINKVPENADAIQGDINKLPEDTDKIQGDVTTADDLPDDLQQTSNVNDTDSAKHRKSLQNALESLMWKAIETASTISETSIPKPPPCTPIDESSQDILDLTQILPLISQDYSSITTDTDQLLDLDEMEEGEPILKEEKVKRRFKIGPEIEIESSLDELQMRECRLYGKIEEFASMFVDDIINTSIDRVVEKKEAQGIKVIVDIEKKSSDARLSSIQTVRWPRISEFTVGVGESSINDFILTWTYDEKWLYCIDFLIAQSDEYSDYYLYEVKWSIPTNPYPIPQATASVFFTIEVSRFKPPFCPVEVTYVFESSRLIHSPGQLQFKESFLSDIINAKLCLYKSVCF